MNMNTTRAVVTRTTSSLGTGILASHKSPSTRQRMPQLYHLKLLLRVIFLSIAHPLVASGAAVHHMNAVLHFEVPWHVMMLPTMCMVPNLPPLYPPLLPQARGLRSYMPSTTIRSDALRDVG